MRASYLGDSPGIIDIDLGGESMKVTMTDARELYATLEDALREAEDGMPTLLPCPYCGGEARTLAFRPRPEIRCDRCCVQMTAMTWGDVVARWNGRADP